MKNTSRLGVWVSARSSSADESSFSTGERVFHMKFGYGAIVAIDGNKLTIEFEKAGAKKVVARFISAADDIPF